ncbi:hypothetical protein SAMN00808754_1969 [Thermanaeromonas toyohensis ToBE]|uniref:Uncharacterized protein n=1 Tax=Thermanaeromonas toyohensis ToBE TaxID=698762 RepID=A0A1W1VWT3_9FIRM|nr:hypothetical protein [Thermanaeromonas toyohensis]SMB97827.1 hypothetical protein SAMN00808754_1969 [Thermanaeromonas toyohensis ToBE]
MGDYGGAPRRIPTIAVTCADIGAVGRCSLSETPVRFRAASNMLKEVPEMAKCKLPFPNGLEQLKTALSILNSVYINADFERLGFTEKDVDELVDILRRLYDLLFAIVNRGTENT